MEDYKQNIVETRKGGLGSSDATMVMSVAKSAELNESAKMRIAVMLGLIEKPEFAKSKAMILGDELEMKMFADYKRMFPNAVSNPLYVSDKLSEEIGFNILNHIDIEFVSENTLVWIECKSSKLPTADVISTYTPQFAWHWILLREKAAKLGLNAQLFLAHFPTNGMFNSDSYSIDRINQVEITEESVTADCNLLISGLKIIANSLPTFEYNKPEVISSLNLPMDVQEGLILLKQKMDDIKRMEDEVNQFKADMKVEMEKLYKEKGIKSIKCDAFSITYIDESESIGFDSAKFKAENPEIFAKYNTKRTKRAAYVSIK